MCYAALAVNMEHKAKEALVCCVMLRGGGSDLNITVTLSIQKSVWRMPP